MLKLPVAMRSVPLLVAFLALALPAVASAATRYAAPGGTAADPCASESSPCSLYVAADEHASGTTIAGGDVVEVEPGTYSDTAGDLGPSLVLQPPPGVTVRGAQGKQRPLIRMQTNTGIWGAFILFEAKVANLEILNEASIGSAISIVEKGTIEGVLARSTGSSALACRVPSGTIRDTVCINDGGGPALGVNTSTFPATYSVTLRNVTALASGPSSAGIDFAYFGAGVNAVIDAKAVIAQGGSKDVVARGLSTTPATPGTGAAVAITLDHSDYATTDTATSGGGSASVTAAGSGTNLTAAPLLAADGYHQLPASPTVDKGAVDGSSGAADVEGQLRTIGSAPDIGADEFAAPTATAVACPASVSRAIPQQSVVCTATVSDTGAGATAPTGEVSFQAEGGAHSATCALAAATPTSSSCEMSYTPQPASAGVQLVFATYPGDVSHTGSDGETTLTVLVPGVLPAPAPSGGALPASRPIPNTLLGKHPQKRSAKRLARFSFSSDTGGAIGFECQLDKHAFAPCSSPFKRRLAPGRHVFRVRSYGPDAIVDPTAEVFRWHILTEVRRAPRGRLRPGSGAPRRWPGDRS